MRHASRWLFLWLLLPPTQLGRTSREPTSHWTKAPPDPSTVEPKTVKKPVAPQGLEGIGRRASGFP